MAVEMRPPTGTGPWVAFGAAVVVLLLGGLVSWAALERISGAVIAAGSIGAESNIKTVQHLDGGIVAEIRVRNGDHVQAGDILLRLDQTSARANLAIIDSRLLELRAQLARLEAERDGADEIAFPPQLVAADRERAAKIMDGQRSLFEARRKAKVGEKVLLEQKIEQARDEIDGLEAQLRAKNEEVALLEQEIESVSPLLEKGLTTQARILASKRQVAGLRGEIGRLISDTAKARTLIGETELAIAQIDKRFLEDVLDELRPAQARINELEEQRVALEDKLRRIDIVAPQTGRVHNLAVHTVGAVIAPGTSILNIVPEDDVLVIEARVSPRDIDQVRLGQPTTIRLSALNARSTPVLEGEVTNISPARLVDPATGAPYFLVTVEIARAAIGEEAPRLLSGMPAEVFIQTPERTVLSYFMKPFTDELQRAFRED